MLGYHVDQGGRHLRPDAEAGPVGEEVGEHPLDPCGDGRGVVGVEVGEAAAHLGAGVGVEVVEAVGPHPAQDRQGQERTIGLHQSQPVGVHAGDGDTGSSPPVAHCAPLRLPWATAGGSRNVTAAGNSRGTGSA